MYKKSIGVRILMVVGTAATAFLVGLVLFYTQSQYKVVLAEHQQVTQRMVATVIAGLEAIMETGTAITAQRYAKDVKSVLELEDFRFVRNDGLEAFLDNQTIDEVNALLGRQAYPPRNVVKINRLYDTQDLRLDRVLNTGKPDTYLDHERHLYTVLMPIENSRACWRCHGREKTVLGFARVVTSLRKAEQSIAANRNWAIVVLGVVLLLYLTFTYFFLHNMVIAPIRRVTDAMHRVAQGDLEQQVPELGEDELGRMARSFNTMTKKLCETYTGLELEQDKLTTIILNAGEGIVVTDRNGDIVLVNHVAETLLGRSSGEIKKFGFPHLVDDPQLIKQLLDHDDPHFHETVQYGDRYIGLMASRISTKNGNTLGMVALMRDVTTQKRRESYLEAMSLMDELTGLLNRRSLADVLAQAVSEALEHEMPLTLLMLDFDHFKQLNDAHGHVMGDRLLRSFGELLKTRLRKTDHAFRYGGEEFTVLLRDTGIEDGRMIAESIRQAVTNLMIENIMVTVSVGLACVDQCARNTPECLLDSADRALYRAKQLGRNRTIVFEASMLADEWSYTREEDTQ
ncbi:MAG: diguanylate cyclase [Candidatus Thiodiazotropha sp.]